jgi:hypothetical protein
MNMNCAHADDDCLACAMMWLWNLVIYCTSCHETLVAFQYAVESETVGTNIDIAIVKYQGKKYIYIDVFMDDYNAMVASLSNARVTFKAAVATFMGLTGMAAFLDENEGTHGGTDGTVIRRDLGLQEASVHKEEFKHCGSYVNHMEMIKHDLAEVMKGITIPRYPGKYVCVNELEIVMCDSCSTCKGYVAECKDEGFYPDDFNPADPQSVREAVENARNF